jgi:hypothetical protein
VTKTLFSQPTKVKPTLAVVHEFGTAPQVVPTDYSLREEFRGTETQAAERFAGEPVVLVKSAAIEGSLDRYAIGVFAWQPLYLHWRHGGWYVTNIHYPSGGCGCVSNNYPDKKWRIVTDNRRSGLDEEGDYTFRTRDAAARAERELVMASHAALKTQAATPPAESAATAAQPLVDLAGEHPLQQLLLEIEACQKDSGTYLPPGAVEDVETIRQKFQDIRAILKRHGAP